MREFTDSFVSFVTDRCEISYYILIFTVDADKHFLCIANVLINLVPSKPDESATSLLFLFAQRLKIV